MVTPSEMETSFRRPNCEPPNKITGVNAGTRCQLPMRASWATRAAQFRRSSKETDRGTMAKGLRRITVDGVPYRWRFDVVLVVIPIDRCGPQLYVDWGWQDWPEPDGHGVEPLVVTPQFVAEAIRFAVTHGWPSASRGRSLRLFFQGGSFTPAIETAEQDG